LLRDFLYKRKNWIFIILFLYFAIFVMRVAERFPLQKKELDLYNIVELI